MTGFQKDPHRDRSKFHGITVVVETDGPTFIGRCHDENEEHLLLLNVDIHDPENADTPKQEWIDKAARFGAWAKHDKVLVEKEKMHSVKPLAEYAGL